MPKDSVGFRGPCLIKNLVENIRMVINVFHPCGLVFIGEAQKTGVSILEFGETHFSSPKLLVAV